MATSNNRPVKRFTRGTLEVSVWKNTSEDSLPWYSTTLERNYVDSDGKWASTKTLDRDSLLVAAEMLREASAWIYAEQAAAKK